MGRSSPKWLGPELKPAAAVAAAAGSLLAGAFCCGALPWYVVPLALGAAFWCLSRPGALVFMAGVAAVLASSGLQNAFAPHPGPGTRALYGRMKLRVEDPRVSRLPELSGRMRTAAATLLEFAEYGVAPSAECRGARLFVRFPRETPPPVYGTLIEAEGVLTPVEALRGDPGGSFDFPAFLRRRGFDASANLSGWRSFGRNPGVRGRLLDARDTMLKTLFDGVDSPPVRQLAAALYCGVGSGMPEDLRRDFSAAGIVHIFSVSGMHVAVLAMFLGVLLRFLPFRARWTLLALAVWGYVLGTGAGTPAVRAGVMVTLWCLLRTALFRLSGFDVLCWTAALLLIVDPKLPASVGAQYSFLITGALLLLAGRRERTNFPRRSIEDFVPAHFRSSGSRRAARCRAWISMLLMGTVTAFLAGAGISLAAPAHRLIPGAVAANILVSLLMPGYFLLFFIQLGFGCCGAGGVTAPLFTAAFDLLRGIAAVARRFPALEAAPPAWPFIALYSFALLAFLRARSRGVRIVSGLAASALLLWWIVAPSCLPPAVMVRSAGSDAPPSVVIAEPERGLAVVVNLPDRAAAAEAADFLRMRGVRTVEVVGVSRIGGGLRALPQLLRELPVKRIRVPETGAGRPGRNVREASVVPAAHFESERFHRDLFRVTRLDKGFRLDYFDPGSKLCFATTVLDCDTGREVRLESAASPPVSAILPWSIDPGVWKYEFK